LLWEMEFVMSTSEMFMTNPDQAHTAISVVSC